VLFVWQHFWASNQYAWNKLVTSIRNDHLTCRVARCTSSFLIFHWQLVWLFIGPLWVPNNECPTSFGLFIHIKCPTSHQQIIVNLMARYHVPTIYQIVTLCASNPSWVKSWYNELMMPRLKSFPKHCIWHVAFMSWSIILIDMMHPYSLSFKIE
jgi:hypothetical protein